MEPMHTAAAQLKSTIRTAVEDALTEFYNKTGVSPSDINIRMIDTRTPATSKIREYMVGEVTLEFKL